MFDAKQLLEALVNGNGRGDRPSSPQGQNEGGLADLLGGLLQGSGGAQAARPGGSGASGGGDLGDILGKIQAQFQQATPGQQSGGIVDVLGQILGQATSGVKDGARQIDSQTGIGAQIRDLLGQTTGRSPEELMAHVQDMIAKNQLGTGAVLGGLGSILLGTRSGRSAASTAAKIGALTLISGLAWKAYQNYQQGRPLVDTGVVNTASAPHGSGFEPEAISNEHATTLIRAMVAAAVSDGRLDAGEQDRITGSLKAAGLDAAADAFIANELQRPASPAELAASVRSPEEAVQVYTAARLAIEVDSPAERAFLSELAGGLDIDPQLAAHVGAASRAI